MDPILIFIAVVAAGIGAGAYALAMRDFLRAGRLHRQRERLAADNRLPELPGGRVPCPECAEAILPKARRCPYCRSVVQGRI
jgi:hypothetical protein